MFPQSRWAGLLIIPFVVVALCLLVILVRAGTGPEVLFTDNIEAEGTSTAITPMEQALLDRLNSAVFSIDAAIYDFNRLSIRDALLAAHNRGVTVRVVTDDEAYLEPVYYPHFAVLEAAGISIINDDRSSIMHNKFFVVDGEVIWTGSVNMSDTGFTYNHENALVLTSTLLADIYTIEFEEMFVDGRFGTAKTDNTTHTVAYNGIPMGIYFSPSDGAMAEVLEAVNGASESIHFGIFFFTDDALRQAMLAKMQSGVTVTGIWDELGAANAYSEDETLCEAGANIKIEDFGGKLHHKFMIIDGQGSNPVVVTGSMNWSAAGDEENDENTLIIQDAAVAQAYLAAFDELYNALGPETLCPVAGGGSNLVYLPLVTKPLPPGPVGQVVITTIFYDGAGSQEPDEYVEIRNEDTQSLQLAGWTLRDAANHVFTFPTFTLQPGQVCRVYTNQIHPSWCGFSFGSGSAVWNNGGDCAELQNSHDIIVDSYCYPTATDGR